MMLRKSKKKQLHDNKNVMTISTTQYNRKNVENNDKS